MFCRLNRGILPVVSRNGHRFTLHKKHAAQRRAARPCVPLKRVCTWYFFTGVAACTVPPGLIPTKLSNPGIYSVSPLTTTSLFPFSLTPLPANPTGAPLVCRIPPPAKEAGDTSPFPLQTSAFALPRFTILRVSPKLVFSLPVYLLNVD